MSTSAPAALLSMCERAQIPMFATEASSAFVIDVLRAYLSKHFADRTTMHGVFMDILGLGVLITGESGLGKSELGLELISRGNGLVADDAVDLYRINQTTIEGRCPELLQNLLEVRGIGLLDIRATRRRSPAGTQAAICSTTRARASSPASSGASPRALRSADPTAKKAVPALIVVGGGGVRLRNPLRTF